MNEEQKRSMLIHFNDGSKKLLDGALVAIPVESIKYLQSSPAPRKLPAYAIRGATFIE